MSVIQRPSVGSFTGSEAARFLEPGSAKKSHIVPTLNEAVHGVRHLGKEMQTLLGLVPPKTLSAGGVMLPSIRVPGDELRLFLVGDTGTGDDHQMHVATSMIAEAGSRKPHFTINLGDLFYENGVERADDPVLTERFDEPYEPLGPMYAMPGNHDHRGNVDAIIDHAKDSAVMVMPARYYGFSYAFGDRQADFFVLDTDVIEQDPEQLAWLAEKFAASTADYKIVLGHHPIHSGGQHGDTDFMKRSVLPIIEGQAKLSAAGHEHDQQVLSTVGGTLLLVSGAGGKERKTGLTDRSHFAAEGPGFSALTLGQEGLQLDILRSSDRSVMHRERLGLDQRATPPPNPKLVSQSLPWLGAARSRPTV